MRLGRLVAHAADADDSASLSQAEFDRRLNYFATSDGQSQIKRNETFARIWRSASALSFRTMKAWADPHNQAVLVETMKDGSKRSNRDLAQARVAKIAKDKLSLPHFEAFSEVIFGNRLINERSRSEIFVGPGSDPDTAREGIWAFLRLGAAMRNGISHLVTKPRLARIISSGLAASDIPKGVEVSFGQLLAFDKMLRRHMIAQEIERLQIAHYATNEQLDEIIRQFGKLPANEPVALPRFMSVLGRVARLAQHIERKQDNNSEIQLQYTLPDELKGLASVKTDLETQTGRGAESCTLGGLRYLYETGFRNWLATDELSEMCVKDTLTLLANIKESRVKSYQAEKGLYFAPDDSILQTLLKEGYSKLPEIFEQLDARASQLQRDFDRFKSDRKGQQEKSNWIDDFKRELFAHLFAKYVKEQGFDWLYALKESSPVVDAGPFNESRIDLPELELAPWHGRFYAWLYLLPLSEISKLRHQMIKSRVLEIRGSDQPQKSELKVLEHADMLMALQLSVRDAGYSGTEHQKLLDLSMDKENQRKGNEFYNSVFGKDGVVIPPFLAGCIRRIHAAIFSFMAGVMPPMPMFGRSLL